MKIMSLSPDENNYKSFQEFKGNSEKCGFIETKNVFVMCEYKNVDEFLEYKNTIKVTILSTFYYGEVK